METKTENENGGIMVGKSHADNGIKFTVKPTGQKIEAEGGEYVICEDALNSTDVLSFKGTRNQIAKKINELFSCSTGVVTGVQAGQYVLCNAATQNDEIIEVKGTVREILNQVAQSVMCNGVDVKGGSSPAPAQMADTNVQPQPGAPVMAQGGVISHMNGVYILNYFFFL